MFRVTGSPGCERRDCEDPSFPEFFSKAPVQECVAGGGGGVCRPLVRFDRNLKYALRNQTRELAPWSLNLRITGSECVEMNRWMDR